MVYFRKSTYIQAKNQCFIADLKPNYADLCAISANYK